jgi:hypothetical protein
MQCVLLTCEAGSWHADGAGVTASNHLCCSVSGCDTAQQTHSSTR